MRISSAWRVPLAVVLLMLAATGMGRQGADGDRDSILDTLKDFNKAYDNTVVGALGKATHAAGRDKLGNLRSHAGSHAAPVGADTASTTDELASFERSYDTSVSSAYLDSEDAEDAFNKMNPLPHDGHSAVVPLPNPDDEYTDLDLGESADVSETRVNGGACECHRCGEDNEPSCCMTNLCDNAGQSHLTNYNDTDQQPASTAACDCNKCDNTMPNKWTDEMNVCCPASCEAWSTKRPPTPPPADTPAPVVQIPKRIPDPARPYMYAGKSLSKPFAEGGVPYEQTPQEKEAEARLRVMENMQQTAMARSAQADTKANELKAKLMKKPKPADYDKMNAKIPVTPPFRFTEKWWYLDKRKFDTGPVNDLPKLQKIGEKPQPDKAPSVEDMAPDSNDAPNGIINNMQGAPEITMTVTNPNSPVAPASGGNSGAAGGTAQ